jgi:citrate synthase
VSSTDVERPPIAPGLEGVVVAETGIGDVRGLEGFYHYREYGAVDLAASHSFEDVWALLFDGELPDRARSASFADTTSQLRALPLELRALLPHFATHALPLDSLRTAVSLLGSESEWEPILDTTAEQLHSQALRLCSVVPTILAAADRLRRGGEPVDPRPELGFAANYLWMLLGHEASDETVRAVEQYLILMIDHGFNASTFTARVIASTGADLAAAICGAVGALSGPLHGGAPSRALDMLDEIGSPDRTESYVREAMQRGTRIMGFGHRVYKTDDPRSRFLRDLARSLGAPLFAFAFEAEATVERLLEELKPGRELHTNAEFYAGVVMDTCEIPREMFTPTFACARMVGWTAHVLEQAAHNRLIRPSARYVGPTPPAPVPPR